MKVKQLREFLSGMPDNAEILIPAPESGYNKIKTAGKTKVYKVTRPLTYLDGTYETVGYYCPENQRPISVVILY